MFPREDPAEPESVGIDRRRLHRVVRRFRTQHSSGAFPGGQLVARRNGKVVLSEACGIARGLRPAEGRAPVQVRPETPFPVLSAGKPLAGIAIALLEDRGALDPDARVASLLPGFEKNGKEEITVLDVLTHRAGVLLPELVRDRQSWADRSAVLRALAEATPSYRRGTLAYMPYEYGWILNEVVLRVDGRTLASFVAEELSGPLGLPDLAFGLGRRDAESLGRLYWLGKDRLILAGINVAEDFEGRNNSPAQFESLNPAVSLVTDAASLAAFYEFLLSGGVSRSGTRLISEKTLRRYTTRNFAGWERSGKAFTAVGRGFLTGGAFPTIFGWCNSGGCFGHPGGFSSLAFADYDTGIAAGIVTNGNRDLLDLARRFIPLAQGLRAACR